MPTNLQQDLFDRIISEENIYNAYKQSLEGKSKYKNDAMKFALDETYNLMQLRQSLADETYRFNGYEEIGRAHV